MREQQGKPPALVFSVAFHSASLPPVQQSSLVAWVQCERAGVIESLPEQYPPAGAVQAGHLEPLESHVDPVQVVGDPVHRHALRVVKAKLYQSLRLAAIQEGPADALHEADPYVKSSYGREHMQVHPLHKINQDT